jgi:hypothetical protein
MLQPYMRRETRFTSVEISIAIPWSKAEDDELCKLWADRSLSRADIAKQLGRSISSVQNKAVRLGLSRRPTIWNVDGVVERLRQLWTEGHSGSEIAQTLGLTSRGAVHGKLFRLGLCRPNSHGPQHENKLKIIEARRMRHRLAQAKARAAKGIVPKWARKSANSLPALAPVTRANLLPAPPSLNVHLVDTDQKRDEKGNILKQCKYIAGAGSLCCAHPVAHKTSWCEHHLVVVSAHE